MEVDREEQAAEPASTAPPRPELEANDTPVLRLFRGMKNDASDQVQWIDIAPSYAGSTRLKKASIRKALNKQAVSGQYGPTLTDALNKYKPSR